jgi:hypothetical protein
MKSVRLSPTRHSNRHAYAFWMYSSPTGYLYTRCKMHRPPASKQNGSLLRMMHSSPTLPLSSCALHLCFPAMLIGRRHGHCLRMTTLPTWTYSHGVWRCCSAGAGTIARGSAGSRESSVRVTRSLPSPSMRAPAFTGRW